MALMERGVTGMKSALRYLVNRPLPTALAVCLSIASAHAADTYNSANNQLTSPSLTICNATYSDIVLTIAGVTSGPAGTSANGSADTFNPAYNLLTIPEVSLGGKDYFNVVASVSGLVSVGSVSGADIYDGQNLTIAAVQVGGSVYTGTVIRVGNIVSVGGGLPKGVRDLYNVESGQLFIPVVQDTVNGHVYTNITVTVSSILSIGSAGNPPTCGALSAGSMLTATQLNAVTGAVQDYYATLTHQSAVSDLAQVASYMVASGIATTATAIPGGISSTLPDGLGYIVFADKPADIYAAASTAVAGNGRLAGDGAVAGTSLSEANPHEIAYLVNMSGDIAFTPNVELQFQTAWQSAGFSMPTFGVDVLDVTLENIAALGSGHPLDFLEIDTHGVASTEEVYYGYYWLSTTEVTSASLATYSADLKSQPKARLVRSAPLYSVPQRRDITYYAFSPVFLTARVSFNPGAIVDNQSCFGQAAAGTASLKQALQPAGVGLYLGWTSSTFGADGLQSDAFMLDRLLGEQSPSVTGLGAYVTQRTPAQRPFPLSDILTIMGNEVRSPVPWTGGAYANDTYTQGCSEPRSANCNKPGSPANLNNLIATTLNNVSLDVTPIEVALPSISSMYVEEAATGGTLVVSGTFPTATGTGQIVDAGGTHALTPTSWSPTQVQFSLPSGGTGASGNVTVLSADGIPSNPVPLTEWKGQLTVTVAPVLSNMNGISGTGGGTITATNNLDFRADVHPVVTTIDTAPQPQNFAISGLMGDSTMTLTSATLSFSGGGKSAQWSLADPGAVIPPSYAPPTPSVDTFIFAPNTVNNEPATCNTGVPGPQSSGPTTVFCPYGGVYVAAALLCSDKGAGLCKAPEQDFEGYYGYPAWVAGLPNENDGLLVFTLNPASYAVTFSTTPASLVVNYYFSTDVNETVTLAATIQPPLNAPSATTPAMVTEPATSRTPTEGETSK